MMMLSCFTPGAELVIILMGAAASVVRLMNGVKRGDNVSSATKTASLPLTRQVRKSTSYSIIIDQMHHHPPPQSADASLISSLLDLSASPAKGDTQNRSSETHLVFPALFGRLHLMMDLHAVQTDIDHHHHLLACHVPKGLPASLHQWMMWWCKKDIFARWGVVIMS